MATLGSRFYNLHDTTKDGTAWVPPNVEEFRDYRLSVAGINGGASDITTRLVSNPGPLPVSREGALASDMPMTSSARTMFPRAPGEMSVSEQQQMLFGKPNHPDGANAPLYLQGVEAANINQTKIKGQNHLDFNIGEYYEVNDFTTNPALASGSSIIGPPLSQHTPVPTINAGGHTFRRQWVDVDMSKQILDYQLNGMDLGLQDALEKHMPTELPMGDIDNTFHAWIPGSRRYDYWSAWHTMAGSSNLPRVHLDKVVTRARASDVCDNQDLRVRGGQEIQTLNRGKPKNNRQKIPMQYGLVQDNETEFGDVAERAASRYETSAMALA